jgi:hypothetical protein
VDKFDRRIGIQEGKMTNLVDQVEKRHENMKDFVTRTKEMLEARVDQIT